MHRKRLTRPQSISAVLITKNEAENIQECLASLSFCCEIIVLDNGSSDGTTVIAKRLGAKVITTDRWLGFGPQKQKALSAATGEWVLSLDADERVTERLKSEIIRVVEQNSDHSYRILRENFFLGKKMRFGGWSGDWVTRLAKRKHCQFTSDVVHESLECAHPTKRLAGSLVHFSYRSINDVFQKQVKYAELGSRKINQAQRNVNLPTLRAVWTFLRLYILQLGFLDGWRGTLAATAKSYETFWRYALATKRIK